MTSFTSGRLAVIALLGTALGLSACASQQQLNQASQDRFGRHPYVSAERISEKWPAGTEVTVAKNETMYSEVIGGLEGARVTAPVRGESWAARFEADAGMVLSRFDTKDAAVYCTPQGFVYNSLAGWNEGCLIDNNKDGVFDEASRLNGLYDYYEKVAAGPLEPPVPYETFRLDEPQFANQMWIRFNGKEDGTYVFHTYGNILAGSDPDYTRLARGNRATRSLAPNARVTIDGITFTVIEVSDASLTFRLEETGFDVIQFTDKVVNGNTRRPFNK